MNDQQDIDYIELDRQLMIMYHGGQTFLEGIDSLDLYYTEIIKDFTVNPLTNRPLTGQELEYIKFRYECYKYTNGMELSEGQLRQLFNWYSESRKDGATRETLSHASETSEAYNIVRFYLTASDFQSHFINFDPRNSDQESFERDLAIKALRESKTIGRWLLRHSSRNRSEIRIIQEKIQRLGIRYYALSYIDEKAKIKHILITCKIGKGWSDGRTWYTNFLDCLEDILNNNGLVFYKQISAYYQDNN